jgi:hypothetical protein
MTEETAQAKEQPAGEGGLSDAERKQLVAEFEAKIEGGEFAGRSFHAAVKEMLYPLLGSGDMDQETFARLVRKWAKSSNPHDWEVRSYLDEG